MKLRFIPIEIEGKSKAEAKKDYVILYRKNEILRLFMHHTRIEKERRISTNGQVGNVDFTLCGDLVGGQSFQDLRDDDILFFSAPGVILYDTFKPFVMEMYAVGDMLLPFKSEMTPLAIAAEMETAPGIYITSVEAEPMITKAKQICDRAKSLYREQPEYQHIMLKKGDKITSQSIVKLASIQSEEKQEGLTALFLAMSDLFKTEKTIADRILEQCEYEEEFSLLTQEEQVSTFIEFSKMAVSKKQEYVSDQMIENISKSPEYRKVLEDFERNGLGVSHTQQFNVFQQVGYFSSPHMTGNSRNILYNLSDMGAGKTLMTVEAIYLMDLKQISNWSEVKDNVEYAQREGLSISKELLLPDKHIIAPTLSVKSSWVDTFKLFYEVTKIDDMTYELSVTYKEITAKSRINVSSFTVKNGTIFVKEKLPKTESGAYLIIDEIHQLVNRALPRTKFFPAKTDLINTYKIFVLSGTMSNLQTRQWFHFLRFIGISVTPDVSVKELGNKTSDMHTNYGISIENAARTIRTAQHRYFDMEPVTTDNMYIHEREKKLTSIEDHFFTKYGTQIICPKTVTEKGKSIETILSNDCYYNTVSDPTEIDAINFNLFYEIVGCHAITAQSVQIAEELFGEQKKQHVSDIIKTVSPLSKADIQILKTLHHIAEDHNQYKSIIIAKAINNAILNLNDGLQTKNIYDIVSGYAERNIKFFEYLSTLDVDILELLPKSGLIQTPKLEDTDKFKVLKDILRREKDETHLIVVNDYYALKSLSDALGIEHVTKDQLKHEIEYQDVLDNLFKKQSIVIVTQDMIKSSLDLIQANRLIQYQLNTEISDIIQTQNRINRIGQTRETRGYYIASDQLQENLIELFLESYRNIRVAHKGIVELFADITSQINVINDYLDKAFTAIEQSETTEPTVIEDEMPEETEQVTCDLLTKNALPKDAVIASDGILSRAILFPQNGNVMVLVPLTTGSAFPYGQLNPEKVVAMNVTGPIQIVWNLQTDTIELE